MKIGLRHALIAIAGFAMPSSAWAACAVTNTGPTALGSYSPPALAKGAPPSTAVPAGFDCPDTVLSLLTGNFLRATVSSADGFTLTSTKATDTVTVKYAVAADRTGANTFVADKPFVYMDGGVINLLGLLGGSARNVNVYVRPLLTDAVAPGTYKGSFTIGWEWRFCSLLGIGPLCAGSLDRSTAVTPAKVDVTMIVEAKPVGIVITTRTTYDPVSATSNPRAIPGSRQRTTITLTNTDIVGVDALNIVLPTPVRGSVALGGDGTASTAYVTTTEGSPASSLAVTYTAPASTTDDVDFSANGGTSWTYDPTAAPRSVTNVRIRPRGTMAAGSSFSVSLPYDLF